ncbi:hypothetical protein G5V59_08995 [Nocardioides sp. W3-2-3]|uniref:hypothetical protein n=1 Tax=Nocardioides convexus TaxID=2712224 RepID=UPI0024189120|nr:hypothetical protein [Nocardioides convexus]NHA00222.1 hypothetical protein [Nocardioides convexus]
MSSRTGSVRSTSTRLVETHHAARRHGGVREPGEGQGRGQADQAIGGAVGMRGGRAAKDELQEPADPGREHRGLDRRACAGTTCAWPGLTDLVQEPAGADREAGRGEGRRRDRQVPAGTLTPWRAASSSTSDCPRRRRAYLQTILWSSRDQTARRGTAAAGHRAP